MTPRVRRFLKIGLISLASLLLLLIVAVFVTVKTSWFEDMARNKVVEVLETATGGRAEIGGFTVNPSGLQITLTDFVLHGTEPAGEDPLFRAARITIRLGLWPSRATVIGISSVEVERPRVNVIVAADGRNNLPEPENPSQDGGNPLETVVNLAIGDFDVTSGEFRYRDRTIPFAAQGEQLVVDLQFDRLEEEYEGLLEITSLHLQQGDGEALDAAVRLPVQLGKDSLELNDASIRTARSNLGITARLENLPELNMAIDAEGNISLRDVAMVTGASFQPSPDAPSVLEVKIDAETNEGRIAPSSVDLRLGSSAIHAEGRFPGGSFDRGTIEMEGNVVIQELVKLLEDPPNASGTLDLQALARLEPSQAYDVDASITGRQLSFRSGGVQIQDGRLTTTLMANPSEIRVNPFRFDVAGGRIEAQAVLEEFNRYRVTGNIAGFQLQRVLNAAGGPESAWGSTISGPVRLEGEVEGQAVRNASARLNFMANGRGIPLTGQVAAVYSGASDSIDIGQSYLVLPASRLEFSGSLNQRLDVRLTSRNLNDFRPALALGSSGPPPALPVQLNARGSASIDATLTGKLSAPVISGQVNVQQFQVQDRPFDRLQAEFRASSAGASVQRGVLTSGPLNAMLSASVGLKDWKPEPAQPISAEVSLMNGDLRDVLVLAGLSDQPMRGGLSFQAQASGTVGDPRGTAELHLRDGRVYGETIDSLDAQLAYGGERITLSSLDVNSNMATLQVSAVFEHPPQEFESGTIRGRIQGNRIALERIAAIQQRRPELQGSFQMDMEVAAVLHPPQAANRVELTAANGTLDLRNVRQRGDALGDLSARVQTSGSTVRFDATSNFAGSDIDVSGRTQLATDYPTELSLEIDDLPVEKVLQVAGRSDIEAKGLLSTSGSASGTWRNPEANLRLELTDAGFQGQPIDNLSASVDYDQTSVEISGLELRAGANRLDFEGSFTHPVNSFSQGDIDFDLETNMVRLAELVHLQEMRPGIGGTVRLRAEGSGRFDQSRTALPLVLTGLMAELNANNLALDGVSYGTLALSASQRGETVALSLDSDVANAEIDGTASIRLAQNYPMTADLSLKNVRYSNLAPLLGSRENGARSFEATAEGSVQLTGLALQPETLRGTAEFSTLEAHSEAKGGFGTPARQIEIQNRGPVRLSLTTAGIEVQQARWTGPSTNIAVSGSYDLRPQQKMDLSLDINTDLAVLEAFDPDISSEGRIIVDTTIEGSPTDPVLNGRMELQDVAYQQAGMLNGISEANGVIALTGVSARIESLRAKSGGGDITLSGAVTRTGAGYRFDVRGEADEVRVRTGSGPSIITDATFQLNGTERSSLLSGEVDIRNVSLTSQGGIDSILTEVAPPPKTPTGGQGVLDNMHLNVNVRMGTTTTFRTAFAESLDASAELTVRGTVTRPGMLGRVVVTQGELAFFGNKYSVNQATVSFYNPTRIEPILNLNLGTTVRGVNVVLMVTGPVQDMNLSYQSDPPLPFSEIVGLLAAGRLPTSDPVLLAKESGPSQTLPQMGASALLGTAVASPIANRLERVFGVTQLKIDPTFTSGSELPQARLTLQQQISPDLTFTYVTNVTRADPQIVRAEWTIDDNWSAIATRQENGMVGVDLFYKRRFQ